MKLYVGCRKGIGREFVDQHFVRTGSTDRRGPLFAAGAVDGAISVAVDNTYKSAVLTITFVN